MSISVYGRLLTVLSSSAALQVVDTLAHKAFADDAMMIMYINYCDIVV